MPAADAGMRAHSDNGPTFAMPWEKIATMTFLDDDEALEFLPGSHLRHFLNADGPRPLPPSVNPPDPRGAELQEARAAGRFVPVRVTPGSVVFRKSAPVLHMCIRVAESDEIQESSTQLTFQLVVSCTGVPAVWHAVAHVHNLRRHMTARYHMRDRPVSQQAVDDVAVATHRRSSAGGAAIISRMPEPLRQLCSGELRLSAVDLTQPRL